MAVDGKSVQVKALKGKDGFVQVLGEKGDGLTGRTDFLTLLFLFF